MLHTEDSMAEGSSWSIVAVVDDDHSVLRSLEYLRESADYAVQLFTSGKELLESGCLPRIDCLISDIDVPGMEGFELLRQVHAARPGLPIILITGYPDTLKRQATPEAADLAVPARRGGREHRGGARRGARGAQPRGEW